MQKVSESKGVLPSMPVETSERLPFERSTWGNFAVASKPLEGGPVGCTVERVPTRVFPDAWPRSGVGAL